MSYYILNSVGQSHEQVAELLRAERWRVGGDEPHGDALAAGDRVLIYLGAPNREFIGRAELTSAVRAGGVLLYHVETWEPPVAMNLVLAELSSNPYAKADFETGVVLITELEYETVLGLVD